MKSAESCVDSRSEIKFIIHLEFKIYFYTCRDVRSIIAIDISDRGTSQEEPRNRGHMSVTDAVRVCMGVWGDRSLS